MRRAGCNRAPACATRRRVRLLRSVGRRSGRGSRVCNGPIAPTDADRPLGGAPWSARANEAPLVSVTMNSARLPTNTNCTMAGTPATIPAATPPDPSKVANNRTARSRNTCFEPFFATSALDESCSPDEGRNNRFFAELEVGKSCSRCRPHTYRSRSRALRGAPKGCSGGCCSDPAMNRF